MAKEKPIALWAVPRSISTAFERVFVEREDFEVLHEPFSASYYYSEDRLSDRYSDVGPEAEHIYENVLASILEPRGKCEGGRAGTGGIPMRNRAPASRGPSARILLFRRSCRRHTSSAFPTITRSAPTPSPAR